MHRAPLASAATKRREITSIAQRCADGHPWVPAYSARAIRRRASLTNRRLPPLARQIPTAAPSPLVTKIFACTIQTKWRGRNPIPACVLTRFTSTASASHARGSDRLNSSLFSLRTHNLPYRIMNTTLLRTIAFGIATAVAVSSALAASKSSSSSSSSRSSSASSSSSSKSYSSSGRQTSKSTTSGNVTKHTSTSGRSLGKSTTTGNTTRHVNASGKTLGKSVRSGNTTKTYDASGKLVGKSTTSGNTTTHRDTSGNKVGTTKRS